MPLTLNECLQLKKGDILWYLFYRKVNKITIINFDKYSNIITYKFDEFLASDSVYYSENTFFKTKEELVKYYTKVAIRQIDRNLEFIKNILE